MPRATPPLDSVLVYTVNGSVEVVPFKTPSAAVDHMRRLRVMYPNVHVWEYSPAVLFDGAGAWTFPVSNK